MGQGQGEADDGEYQHGDGNPERAALAALRRRLLLTQPSHGEVALDARDKIDVPCAHVGTPKPLELAPPLDFLFVGELSVLDQLASP